MIKQKSIVLRAKGKFPIYLWREIYASSVYLHNRTPRAQNAWISPYEAFHEAVAFANGLWNRDHNPKITHLRAFGCKAYTLTRQAQKHLEKKKSKMNPRAWIGYLIGYDSTNTYRIWNPVKNLVIRTRDVIFDEHSFFSGNTDELRDDLRELSEEAIEELMKSFLWQPGHASIGNVLRKAPDRSLKE